MKTAADSLRRAPISAIQKPEVGRPDAVHQPPVMTDA